MDIDDIKYIKTVTKKRDRRGEYKRLKVHYCVYCGDEVTKENEFTRDTCNKRECKFKKLKVCAEECFDCPYTDCIVQYQGRAKISKKNLKIFRDYMVPRGGDITLLDDSTFQISAGSGSISGCAEKKRGK